MANEIKKQNPELFYWDNKKIHIGDLTNDDVKQGVNDTMVDFFIMSKCDRMFCYAFNGISGFSKIVSLIFDKEYININTKYDNQNMSIHTFQKK